jgi:hypothetical protein
VGQPGPEPEALQVSVRRDNSGPLLAVTLEASPIQLFLSPSELAQADPQGLVTKLENRLRSLEETRDQALADQARLRHEAAAAKARLGDPFPHAERLRSLQRRQTEIERELLSEPEPAVTPAEMSATSSVAAQAYPASPSAARPPTTWPSPATVRPAPQRGRQL